MNIMTRQLQTGDLSPALLDTFAHCQQITKKWVNRNGSWVLTDTSLLRQWSPEKRIWITEYLAQQLQRGGAAIGAFCDAQLTGFCCVDGSVYGNTAKYANMTMLFVDDHFKRKGIGQKLFQKACNYARQIGAEKLFISAIPSQETIAFYLKMGCIDAEEIIEGFVDSEDDRYLEIALTAALPTTQDNERNQ